MRLYCPIKQAVVTSAFKSSLTTDAGIFRAVESKSKQQEKNRTVPGKGRKWGETCNREQEN